MVKRWTDKKAYRREGRLVHSHKQRYIRKVQQKIRAPKHRARYYYGGRDNSLRPDSPDYDMRSAVPSVDSILSKLPSNPSRWSGLKYYGYEKEDDAFNPYSKEDELTLTEEEQEEPKEKQNKTDYDFINAISKYNISKNDADRMIAYAKERNRKVAGRKRKAKLGYHKNGKYIGLPENKVRIKNYEITPHSVFWDNDNSEYSVLNIHKKENKVPVWEKAIISYPDKTEILYSNKKENKRI